MRIRTIQISVLILAALTAAACLPDKAPLQTGSLTDKNVRATDYEAWIRIADFTNNFIDTVVITGDRIEEATDDPEIIRTALLWKLNATASVMSATSSADPGIALIDAWALCLQYREALTTGVSREAFGEYQGLAITAASALLSEIEVVIRGMTVSGDAPVARTLATNWAADSPIANPYFIRRMATAELMSLAPPQQRGALAAVSGLAQTVDGLSSRLATYANLLPRQARWQAELALMDAGGNELIGEARAALQTVTAELGEIGDIVEGSPALDDRFVSAVESVNAAVEAAVAELERVVERQRVATIEIIESQAPAAAAFAAEERAVILGQLSSELATALARVDEITARTVADSQLTAEQLVDDAYGKAFRLILLFFAGVLVLMFGYWLLFARG